MALADSKDPSLRRQMRNVSVKNAQSIKCIRSKLLVDPLCVAGVSRPFESCVSRILSFTPRNPVRKLKETVFRTSTEYWRCSNSREVEISLPMAPWLLARLI